MTWKLCIFCELLLTFQSFKAVQNLSSYSQVPLEALEEREMEAAEMGPSQEMPQFASQWPVETFKLNHKQLWKTSVRSNTTYQYNQWDLFRRMYSFQLLAPQVTMADNCLIFGAWCSWWSHLRFFIDWWAHKKSVLWCSSAGARRKSSLDSSIDFVITESKFALSWAYWFPIHTQVSLYFTKFWAEFLMFVHKRRKYNFR